MKKLVCVLTLFLLCQTSFAQEKVINGILLDSVTQEPVAFAAIGTSDYKNSSITNKDGEFVLKASQVAEGLIISHLNYGKQTILFDALKIDNEQLKLYIRASDLILDEVIISDIPIIDIIERSVIKSQAALMRPAIAEAYVREFVKTNERYTKFSDGLISYEITGSKKLKSRASIKDSRAIELYDESEEEVDFDLVSPIDIRKVVKISKIEDFSDFLSRKNDKKYNYQMRSRKDNANNEYLIISASPKRSYEGFLLAGEIIIDAKTDLILEINDHLPDSHKEFAPYINLLIVKAKLLTADSRAIFKYDENGYYLFYKLIDRSLRLWNKRKYDEEFRVTLDVIVTEISEGEFADEVEIYNKKSLYKRNEPLKSKFWLNNNVMKLTEEQQSIVDELSKQ